MKNIKKRLAEMVWWKLPLSRIILEQGLFDEEPAEDEGDEEGGDEEGGEEGGEAPATDEASDDAGESTDRE